jgi:molybdopterin-binding protein
MKISARNQLKARSPGATTSHVSIDIGQGSMLTASLTNEAVADLGLKVGDDVWAIIKASDVLVAKYSVPCADGEARLAYGCESSDKARRHHKHDRHWRNCFAPSFIVATVSTAVRLATL